VSKRGGGIFIEKSIPFFGPFTVTQTSHSKTKISLSTNSKNIVWSALCVVVVVAGPADAVKAASDSF
jgi:hypothetical protein